MNVDVSSDGETLVFDLLGDIYSLPLAGGNAVALTSGPPWDQAPLFSPDGRSVYLVSDREGYKNIWKLSLDDQSLRQITRLSSDVVGGPNWSQYSSTLLAGVAHPETYGTEFILHSIDPVTGVAEAINPPPEPWIDRDTLSFARDPIRIFSGVASGKGKLFFSRMVRIGARYKVRMYRLDLNTYTGKALTAVDTNYSEYKPQLSHNGDMLAYFRQYDDRSTEIRILNIRTEEDEPVFTLTNADDASYTSKDDSRPNYAFTPDDKELIFWHDGKIHRLRLADHSIWSIPWRITVERETSARVQPSVQRINDTGEVNIIRWPSLSHEQQVMVFTAIGYVWIMDLKTFLSRRLTNSNEFEYMPSLSPDGKSVVYTSFEPSNNDYWPGRLMIAEIDSGSRREVLSDQEATYLLPRWSADGSKIAAIQEVESSKPGVQAGVGGIDATFGWVSSAGGEFHEVASTPSSTDPVSVFIYSRFIGFDATSRNLIFSFPRSKSETILATASISGGSIKILATGTPEVGGITPSPDMNHLALTRDDDTVWVVPFKKNSQGNSLVSTSSSGAYRISSSGGYYVDWSAHDQLSYGFGKYVFRHHVDRANTIERLEVKLPFKRPQAMQPIAFTGARLITMSRSEKRNSVIESGTVLVHKRRIAKVGPHDEVNIPREAVVIDVTGKTIIPGLIDSHYHRIGGPGISALRLPNPAFNDPSAIKFGITTAWEPGGPVNDGVPATVDLHFAGRILGPRWSHSARGTVGGFPWDYLTSYTSALEAVEQHRLLGVDVLKEYNTPMRQQRQWLSAAAYQKRLGVVSHIQTFEGMMTRIIDGYTGGDHSRIPVPFYKDVRELLQQTEYIWTPNLAITFGTVGNQQHRNDYFCQAVLEWRKRTRPRIKEEINAVCGTDPKKLTIPYATKRVGQVAEQIASVVSDGVNIGVSGHGKPGWMLHSEMWFLRKGGMSIEEVLQAATLGNARKLGLQEEVGLLESGKIADFLVLDANPLDDILNTMTTKYTIQGGVIYDSDTGLPIESTSTLQ